MYFYICILYFVKAHYEIINEKIYSKIRFFFNFKFYTQLDCIFLWQLHCISRLLLVG